MINTFIAPAHDEHPLNGLLDYFVKNFTNSQFEYGTNRFGICRYPLDSAGHRIVEELEYCPHTLGLDGGFADKSETVALLLGSNYNLPSQISFRLNPDVHDIYSAYFGDLDCENIDAFFNRFKQHMDLLNKVQYLDVAKFTRSDDFNVFFNFKYDHAVKKIFREASISFPPLDNSHKRVVFNINSNMLITLASLRKMDMEFFNRYYKHKIIEAMPDLSSDQIYDLMDISNWPESLKTLVKISHY